MKIDKRVVIGGLVVIIGVFLLWLLRNHATAPAPAQQQASPDSPPPVTTLTRANKRPASSGCGCDDGCSSSSGRASSYVDAATHTLLPADYLAQAAAMLDGLTFSDSSPAPASDGAGYGAVAGS